ncbi:hypothetical protein ACFE04_011866 [Oxalis oulophora]
MKTLKKLFTKKPDVKEALRESKREMAHATRAIEKEISALQFEERKLVAEIKRTAKTGNEAMNATTSVSVGMKGASKAMAAMNKQMAPAKQAKIIMDFQKQATMLDNTTEMISDAIDEVLDNDEAEEETEELTHQVLDEIGVDVASQLSSAPKNKIAGKRTEVAAKKTVDVGSSGVDDLEKRLAALRNP